MVSGDLFGLVFYFSLLLDARMPKLDLNMLKEMMSNPLAPLKESSEEK